MTDIFDNDSDPITTATQNTESSFHISNTEPITKPFHVLPSNTEPSKLSKGAIAGIVIGCLVGFGLILFLILFFTLKSKNNNGDAKFGTVQYGDSKTGASGPFKPKEAITVKYLPKILLNAVKFSVSTDSGATFTPLSVTTGSTNTTTWTIPTTVFSNTCFLQVEDGTNSKDFLRTDYFSVIPQIILISGPGATRVDSVYINTTASVQLDFDSVISDLNVVSDWDLTFSETNKEKFKPVFSGTVQAITPGTGSEAGTNRVSWIIPTAPPDPNSNAISYYWRLTTKTLKALGYPSELYVESHNPINIINAPPPPPGTFSILVKDNISGSVSSYVPGDAVTIRVASSTSISGITFTYFDGMSNTPLTPTGAGVVVDSITTDFPWKIPDTVFTDKFSVSAVLTSGATAKSSDGTVEPFFSWDQPKSETTINSYVAAAPTGNIISTTIAFRGSLTFTNWEVGFVDTKGFYQPLASKVQGSTTVTIDWSASQEQLGLDPTISGLPNNIVNYKFYVRVSNASGQTVTIMTPSNVIWFGAYWVPTLSYLETNFPNLSYVSTLNNPPLPKDFLDFTIYPANPAVQFFAVPSLAVPKLYSYLIYLFPNERPLPETFDFLMIQPDSSLPCTTLAQNVTPDKAITIIPVNGNPADPKFYTVRFSNNKWWTLAQGILCHLDTLGPTIFSFGTIVPNVNPFGS